jgi:hypothetical protein
MASTDAVPVPRKGVAFRATFPIYDADGDLVTGAAGLDSEISKDAGTFADCTNEATEIATSSGVYYLDLSSTEMDADTVAIIVKTSTSGAKTTVLVFYPETAGDIRSDAVLIGGQTASASGTVTFPNATLASTTNITAGTITTVSGNVTGNVGGSVGSVTGAVGSVTGNVGGNVVGSVASVAGNVGGNVVGSVASVTGAVGSVTGNVGGSVASVTAGVTVTTNNDKTGYALTVTPPTAATIATAVLTTQMTESYNTDGTAPTLAQALFVSMQRLTEFAISGTTVTIKKLDGSTTAATLTLDSATTPTSSTRAT